MNVKNLSYLVLSLLTLVVFGCGGGGESTPDPNAPAALSVSAAPVAVFLNNPATITARVLKADGTAVTAGTVVTFTTTGGTLSAVTPTNASGDATASLTSTVAGALTVTASVGSLPAKTVVITYSVNPDLPVSVAVTGASTADINTSVVLTATVTPGVGGTIADGTVVTFASLTPGAAFTAATTTGGVATTTLTGVTTPATVNITASAGGVVSPAQSINFVDPNSPNSITMSGSTTPGFINGQRPVIITANVARLAGGPVPAGTPVSFAITAGTGGTLTTAGTTSDASGNATTTLNSTAEGSITVRATAASATGTTTIAFSNPNKPGSITLIASPGSGVANNLVPVTLTATVTPADVANGTIPNGTAVSFTILSGTGTLSSTTATTTGGVAAVTLNSTIAGSISINASAGVAPLITSNSVSVPFVTQPTLVSIKLATTGSLPIGTLISGVTAKVTASPSSGLTIQTSDIVSSGVSVGSLLAANTSAVNAIQLAMINVNGFTTGEFATLNYHVSTGTFPTAGDFTPATVSIIDGNGTAIPGITVTIQSITIQ